MNTIILILKDQLSLNISSLKNFDKKNDIIQKLNEKIISYIVVNFYFI